MCTLILGLEVLGPNTLLVGANRDESPGRPTAGPALLREAPRVVGGRDLLAGGTWLAVREAGFVAALMNRRPVPGEARDPRTIRSRGLLCLEAAAAEAPEEPTTGRDLGPGAPMPPPALSSAGEPGSPIGRAAPAVMPGRWFLDAALTSFERHVYGHCTLVGVGTDGEAWCIHGGEAAAPPRVDPIARGWHVITHADLDDRSEPRTLALLDALGDRVPASVDAAIERIASLLRGHGENGARSVCLHGDPHPTVSSSILALGYVGRPRYLHAPGPPCVTPYEDFSGLLGTAR